jgi:hypothetical protein
MVIAYVHQYLALPAGPRPAVQGHFDEQPDELLKHGGRINVGV